MRAAPASLSSVSAGVVSSMRSPVAPAARLVSQPAVIAFVLAFDVAAILIAGVASRLRAYEAFDFSAALALLVAPACVALILKSRWFYTIASLGSAVHQILAAGVALVAVLGGLLLAHVLLGADIVPARAWALQWLAGAWAMIAVSRLAVSRLLAGWTRAGRLARRTVIVGGGKPTFDLIERLDRSGSSAIQILGIFDDRDKYRSPEQVGRYAKLGKFEDLEAFCREQRVDLLIIALPTVAEERILHVLKMLWVLPIDVRIAALGSKLKLRSRAYNYIGDVPFLPVFDKPMNDWSVALKAIEDRLIAALGLIVLSPLLALIAVAVKLDSRGPALFRQQRYGFNNEAIGVYKFRSMYVDQCDANATRLVTRGDPRVTRVGAFIRKTSLDELPQLFNVLKGELSLVGPRPHAMQAKADGRIYDEVVEGYFARHKVKPGITGWAQVNGWRGETDTLEKIEQRVAHDIHYIENWSMWLDLRILFLTPWSLVTGKNAF
ncbi:MAG: undecaprenyl-phosphate glucose phosphotransferase [Hyphomicrobiales bacterium]|nr:undecaprenyl-phosphate glucose phosphotransferase [Hyphomicrobiales bacterium]